ncbi:FGFR1 oncogene partner 2 homolog isoform X1 [Sitodiplosis mosellana]|uniref:FGFR1 oncogene partner 2 homolog isoform X1 n=1 Tax=Sitodiplosis mosellana TaxID=263140 RepID=UPI0024449DBF|nr:FGFR1 oncogene partner 2 homolog isoform X1 [Sitodiplosis mosellana]
MSSSSLESIIVNAKRLAQRLKSREADADRILAEAEEVNNQLETMRQFKDDLDLLNSIARDKSNAQMIHQINQENPQLREMHTENMRLRVSLEDHQRALEHIMSKYREHTQLALNNTKLNFQELFKDETEKSLIIQRQEEKIQEMIAIMQKAATLDDSDFEQNLKKDRENISRLIVENQGLRELLQISQKYGTGTLSNNNAEAGAETEADANVTVQETNKISVETQTDSNANQC